MAADVTAGVRLIVWRPYMPERLLAMQQDQKGNVTLLGSDAPLQQAAFMWQVREDIWGGIVDAEVRQSLSQRFIADFEPVLPPDDRSFEKLSEFLRRLSPVLVNSEWSFSAQQLDEDGESGVRLNALVGFFNHLRWVYDVFKDVPGASVSVR